MLCTNTLKSFEDKLLNETTHITTVKEILDSLMVIGEIYSEQTARTKLEQFKKCMYYCSFASGNPMFLVMAQDELQLSDELIYIHELMFKFLCKKHNFLEFDFFINISSKYDTSSFSWRIPKIFMPILASYILATAFLKKKHSTIIFFSKMDEYFNSSLNTSNGYTKEVYEEWTNQYLGREYFYHLDNIYETYAKTQQQQTVIRESFSSLTKLLVDAPVPPNTIPAQIYSLLAHCEMNLTKHIKTLYPHNEPWEMDFESKLIESLTRKMLQLPDELLRFLEASLDRNSTYKIAVSDFESFRKEANSCVEEINSKIEKSIEVISETYLTIKTDPDFVRAIEDKRFIFNEDNFNSHAEFLNTAVSKYSQELNQKITTFIKKVEQASNPEKSFSLYIDMDYFKEFKEDIKYEKRALKKKLNDNFNKLPSFLFIHKEGYIKEHLSYPIYSFGENDILRITYELTNNYLLSEEHILNHFKNKGLRFPVPRLKVISFLLNFDAMIAEL